MNSEDKIDCSYDDITIGTPVYIGSRGCEVYIPIKKHEEVQFREKIEKLEDTINYLEEENKWMKKHLKRKYKKRYLKFEF